MDDDRCTAGDRDGNRCQLFAEHHGHEHAALIFTGPSVYSRGTSDVLNSAKVCLRVTSGSDPSVRREARGSGVGVSPNDASAPPRGGADVVWFAQARARSIATGTGLLTMSRTGE
jgi:hypothetical protein